MMAFSDTENERYYNMHKEVKLQNSEYESGQKLTNNWTNFFKVPSKISRGKKKIPHKYYRVGTKQKSK